VIGSFVAPASAVAHFVLQLTNLSVDDSTSLCGCFFLLLLGRNSGDFLVVVLVVTVNKLVSCSTVPSLHSILDPEG
jgi:hypothetical protein